jgi:hypothetical protein
METVLFALKYTKHLVKEHLLKPFESLHGLMVQYAKPDCEFDKYVPRHRRHEKVEVVVNSVIQLCQKFSPSESINSFKV